MARRKGKRQRYEEARALKRGDGMPFLLRPPGTTAAPCSECDAGPGAPHASWCEATEVEEPLAD